MARPAAIQGWMRLTFMGLQSHSQHLHLLRQKEKKTVKTGGIEIDPSILQEETGAGHNSGILHRRIQMLDPFDRAIVLLWLEDLPYEEIGQIIGITAKAVGVRLVRIREKLKKINLKD